MTRNIASPQSGTAMLTCPLCGSASNAHPICAAGIDFEYHTLNDTFTFRRCSECHVAYLCPRPATELLPLIYPKNYAPYTFNSSASITVRIRNWLEQRKIKQYRTLAPEVATVLDVGCGTPSFLDNLKRFGSPTWELWGNDITPETLQSLAERGHHILPGRFEQIDTAENSFNLIFFRQVLEHLESPREVILRAAKSLVPGGRLVVETPNEHAWDAKWFSKRYWGGYHFPRHWTIFNPNTLRHLAEGVGLEVESISYMLSPSFWVQSVHHVFDDRKWGAWLSLFFTHVNPLAMGLAVGMDVLQLAITRRTSNMRAILRRPAQGEIT